MSRMNISSRVRRAFHAVSARSIRVAFIVALIGGVFARLLGGQAVTQRAPFAIKGLFFPSGWMGDGAAGSNAVDVNEQWTTDCKVGPTCIRVTYRAGSKNWAGVYWQYPDGNWGDKEGRTIASANKLTFWAKGAVGGELVEFKIGGITGKRYADSLEKTIGTVKLNHDWEHKEILLRDESLRSVIGAFAWLANARGNPKPLVFYLDDIRFE